MDKEILKEKIRQNSHENRLTCAEAHKIAAETGCRLLEIGTLCNELGIKIAGCLLGCF